MRKQYNLKLLADLNISIKTTSFLASLGYDIKRITANLRDDEEVVETAINEERTIITFDKDFGEIYYFYKKNFSVIVLYLRNQTPEQANKILKEFLEGKNPKLIKNKLIILYEGRYRIIDYSDANRIDYEKNESGANY